MNQNAISSHRRGNGILRHLSSAWRILCDADRLPLYFALAALLTFLVESLSRRSPFDAVIFLIESPLAYLANYGIILCTILPALLFRKRLAGLALCTTVWVALGIAQCIVLLSRVTPLTAVDVAIALSVITIISAYLTPFQIILIAIAIITLFVILISVSTL